MTWRQAKYPAPGRPAESAHNQTLAVKQEKAWRDFARPGPASQKTLAGPVSDHRDWQDTGRGTGRVGRATRFHLEKRHEGLSRDIPGYPDLVYIPG